MPRPIHKIDKLVHPASIGLVGVSATSMNFGRIILRNLMGSGYGKDRLTVIRAGETEVDGVRCVASLSALESKLDLLIVAVAADAVYSLVDEIIATDAAESVMLIPGGLGETATSREPAAALAARINAAHANEGGGPIFLGANCLGVVSHPGSYDSWFIPLERLPKPAKKPQRNSVMLSQSGAFMITRMSQNPWLDPAYMLALGNQTDLTHGDLLAWFAQRPEIETIGIYIEGFKDRGGLDFVRAVRRAVVNGKAVVVYKAGSTAPGARGVMGHTASVAGNAALFDSVVRHAGAMVADDFNAFDDLFYIAGALHRKSIGGNRLGGISGAGFEAVGIADSIATETFAMEMGALGPDTVKPSGRDPDGEAAGRAGGDQEPHRHQPRRRRRGPPADHRGLPAGPEHRRRRGRTRPDRAGDTRARSEQAAARIRHQRSAEQRAPDAAFGRAQRQAGRRHRGRGEALRRDGRRPDGSRRLRVPQLRPRHAGTGALRRGADLCGRAAPAAGADGYRSNSIATAPSPQPPRHRGRGSLSPKHTPEDTAMSEPLAAGQSRTERISVDRDRTISFMGEECRVYSTPKLLYDIEIACRNLLLAHLEPGKDSVGTRVELDHIGATLMGMWAEITVTLTEVNGNAVTFDFSARDAIEEIARGRHSRYIVGIEKTAQRLKAKLAKAIEAGTPKA